jgi:hypothetical protein
MTKQRYKSVKCEKQWVWSSTNCCNFDTIEHKIGCHDNGLTTIINIAATIGDKYDI